MNKLNLRERRIVDAFLGSCNGNGTEAAITAGYTLSRNRNAAGVVANRLQRNPKIRAHIDRRTAKDSDASIATAEERDRLLSDFARQSTSEVSDRLRAIAELNKCSGRHSVKHHRDETPTLEMILGASRK